MNYENCNSSVRIGDKRAVQTNPGPDRRAIRPATFALLLVLAGFLLVAGCVQTGSVTVSSVPAGARIMVNGIDNGTAPALLADWPAGNYTVEARNPGSINTEQMVRIIGGGNGTATITLPPIPMPADKTVSGVTDLTHQTTENIAYLGGFSTRTTTSGHLERVQFVVGKTAAEIPGPLRLEGAGIMLVTKKEFADIGPDTPLYAEGRDPAPGHWRITKMINSEPDNILDTNEQFTIVVIPGPGQVIPMNGTASIEIKPRIGAALVAWFSAS